MITDKILKNVPSKIINTITGGSKGSSLCGRLYLYKRYINAENPVVNTAICIIDSVEKNHCMTSARYWRIRVKKEGVIFPCKYNAYL